MFLSLPFRFVLHALVIATVLIVAGVGWLAPSDGIIGVQLALLRWASILPAIFLFVLYWAWRLCEPLQRITFPYLGGTWTGTLCFETNDGKTGDKPACLLVRHTLFGLHLRLTTDQSTSRTLAVAPERDPNFGDFRLYYVFEVSRLDGVGASSVYRGTALVRIAADLRTLSGDYFTEHKSIGRIDFQRPPTGT